MHYSPEAIKVQNCFSQRKLDYLKLIFAALILVVLRIWDAIYVSLSYHPHYDRDVENSEWIVVLIFLAVSYHYILQFHDDLH